MEHLQVFSHDEFGSVRTLLIGNEPYFVGKDVTDILGYSNSRDALSRHVAEEDRDAVGIHDAIGREQLTVFINESGLYSLILSSKLPAAKRFKHWITSEVLPAIRKHGVYAVDEVLNNPDLLLSALEALKQEREAARSLQETVDAQQELLTVMEPKAAYYDKMLACPEALPITVIAKDYGWSARQMNAFLRKHQTERNYDFIRLVLDEELCCSASIDGTENIPSDGKPVIFVSNHPLGGLDGMIIAQMIHESRSEKRELKVIVNELLMYMEPLAGLWAPVSKTGMLSKEQAIRQKEMWESKTDVLTFPAGACSRLQRIDGKWQIRDLEWQKNFVQRAREYKRNIVPIYFEGQNSRFFYVLALLRKILHIKLNIEMLYLVDEMYGAHGKHFKVHVLPPIPYSTFDSSKTPKQWAQYVKSIVYATNNSTR